MANVAVTNTFAAATTISSSQVNTNFSDLVTYINNRNGASATWDNVTISSTNGNALAVTSSASTTEFSINNTAADGDSEITFKLSGSQTHIIGVDDSDSDFLKFATTGITSNVAMQIPTTGAQAQFNAGVVGTPGISFIGDTDTGFYNSGANVISVTTNATLRLSIGDQLASQDGAVGAPFYSFTSDLDTGMWRSGAEQISFSTNGQEALRVDNSATAANMRLLVYDVTAASVVRVSRGASDSGGAGFRVLRVPN